MKKLTALFMALLICQIGYAQNIDVKVDPDVNPDIDIDVNGITKAAIKSIVRFGGDDDDDDKGKYQQDSQEVEIPLTNPGERGTLEVDSRNGRVTITGYDGVTVKVKIIKYSKKVEKTSSGGMRMISSGGFNFEAEEYNNNVKVENEGWNNRADFEIQVPRNFNIKAETYNNGHISIKDIEGELDIESYNGPITLENISGSASASTYNGAITATFASVTADMPMTFNTYNGDVDITVPSGTKFSTKMRTNREIYTDFESFDLVQAKPTRNRDERRGGTSIKYENWVQGELNGGGAAVTMKTRNGNIYIRKG